MYRSLDIPCTNVLKCISGLTAAILNFWVISACVTIDKTSLSSPNKKTNIQRYFIPPYHVYQGCLLRATILLILDFHQPKLLIWRHAYWGHVIQRSWNRCCPVENLFVHKVIKNLCPISSDKKSHSKEYSGDIPPICNTWVTERNYDSRFWSMAGGWV